MGWGLAGQSPTGPHGVSRKLVPHVGAACLVKGVVFSMPVAFCLLRLVRRSRLLNKKNC